MIRLLLCGICVIGVLAPALPAVDVAPVNKRDQPIVIKHESGEVVNAIFGKLVDGRFAWSFLPDAHFDRGETKTTMAAPPGDYIITTGDSKIIKVIEEGRPDPGPSPEPRPDPRPEPNPEPSPDQVRATRAIWIEEIDDRANHIEAMNVTRNPAAIKSLTDRGISVSVYDDDQEAARKFLSSVTARPAFILWESDARMVVVEAPKSAEALEQLIRKHVVR